MPKPTPTTPPLGREAKRRLAVIRHVEEVTGNVAMSCRYLGRWPVAQVAGVHRQVRVEPGFDTTAGDQRLDLVEGRLRGEFGGQASRSAQHAAHVPQFVQRPYAQCPDGARGVFGVRVSTC